MSDMGFGVFDKFIDGCDFEGKKRFVRFDGFDWFLIALQLAAVEDDGGFQEGDFFDFAINFAFDGIVIDDE